MVRIRESTIIRAPIETVWDILRDFNSHGRWHPAIADSRIEGEDPSTRIGAVRNFRLRDGSVLREQLLSLSDKDHRLTYCLLESPIPLMNYVAEIRLRPVTDGSATYWEWSSRFDPPAHRRDELVAMVTRDIYQAGFVAIRALLGRSAFRAPMPTAPVPARSQTVPQPPVTRTAAPAVDPAPSGIRTEAIVVDRYGGPEVMEIRGVELASPRAGEVRLLHTAIGVNYIDVYCRTGFFNLLTPPGTPGMEAAGIVEAIGAGITDLQPGDRVAYACPPVGAYSRRRTMSAELLVKLPPYVADELAAAGLLKGITAHFLLHDIGRVEPGQFVLIHAAAGGVGQLLVQWARALGATVIATTSSPEKVALVRSLGADHVINYSQQDFAAEVMAITAGHGADVIYDAVGRDTLAGSIAALAICGHLVSFGQASGPIGMWDIDRFAAKSITFSRPNYGHYTDTPEKVGRHVGAFFRALQQGFVRVDAPTSFPLEQASEAHRFLESRRSTGSIILVP